MQSTLVHCEAESPIVSSIVRSIRNEYYALLPDLPMQSTINITIHGKRTFYLKLSLSQPHEQHQRSLLKLFLVNYIIASHIINSMVLFMTR